MLSVAVIENQKTTPDALGPPRLALSSVLEAIELHRLRVSRGLRYSERCTRCESSIGFTKHEARRRQVRVLVDLTVQIVKITILRWRCVACRRVFTDLPDFPASLPAVRDALPARLGG